MDSSKPAPTVEQVSVCQSTVERISIHGLSLIGKEKSIGRFIKGRANIEMQKLAGHREKGESFERR
jgi:hypothetical protein